MQKTFLCLMLGILLSLPAAANDPFDKTQRHRTKPEHAQKTEQPPAHSCQTGLFPNTPFAQIQIVGIIQQQKDYRLILQVDQQVHLANVGDVIAAEAIKIDHITKQKMTFLRRENNQHCEQTLPFHVQF
jgi:comD, putative